jgi:hypothetical protein
MILSLPEPEGTEGSYEAGGPMGLQCFAATLHICRVSADIPIKLRPAAVKTVRIQVLQRVVSRSDTGYHDQDIPA